MQQFTAIFDLLFKLQIALCCWLSAAEKKPDLTPIMFDAIAEHSHVLQTNKNYLIQLNNSKLQAITKMSSQIVYPSTASECYLMLQLLHIQWHMFN